MGKFDNKELTFNNCNLAEGTAVVPAWSSRQMASVMYIKVTNSVSVKWKYPVLGQITSSYLNEVRYVVYLAQLAQLSVFLGNIGLRHLLNINI